MRRLGWKTELDMMIDIIGISMVNGSIVKDKLIEKGMDFKTPYFTPSGNYIPDTEFDEFITYFLNNNIIEYNPDYHVVSVHKIDNDYCLSKSYLREYRINEILS